MMTSTRPGLYRYAYLGLRRGGAKLHILHIGGVLCRPGDTDYWTPKNLAAVEVDPHDERGWWQTFLAAHILCARCRQRFEALTAPPC